ncbi:MAG: DNA-binding protein [Candidatus Wallbacteria bacterium HGW-Wallbacteria-1]|uniref:DNA-binding protein n=1 Tax=Candidatus Wallbacteria bacterium HGW-Wallbacteria-1 TaxID=2013854 RepID=A0A2N1PK60_9BACT|nr:MAG: DNA-binding protein [Candidatus Wallbacteria bacterium HGW-Wallbacteria-1]
MNKTDLIDVIARRAEITKKEATKAVETMIEEITASLKDGDKVSLMGFGSWEVKTRAARSGRNPQSGKTITIEAKKVAKFNAGKELREAVDA